MQRGKNMQLNRYKSSSVVTTQIWTLIGRGVARPVRSWCRTARPACPGSELSSPPGTPAGPPWSDARSHPTPDHRLLQTACGGADKAVLGVNAVDRHRVVHVRTVFKKGKIYNAKTVKLSHSLSWRGLWCYFKSFSDPLIDYRNSWRLIQSNNHCSCSTHCAMD